MQPVAHWLDCGTVCTCTSMRSSQLKPVIALLTSWSPLLSRRAGGGAFAALQLLLPQSHTQGPLLQKPDFPAQLLQVVYVSQGHCAGRMMTSLSRRPLASSPYATRAEEVLLVTSVVMSVSPSSCLRTDAVPPTHSLSGAVSQLQVVKPSVMPAQLGQDVPPKTRQMLQASKAT